MPGFLREHAWSLILAVLLHGALAAALVLATLVSLTHSVPIQQPLPIDATVVDSQVLHAAQKAMADRVSQDAARARAEADARAAAAAQASAAAEAQQQQEHAADQAKVAAEADAAAKAVAAEQQHAEAAKQAAAQKSAELERVAEAQKVAAADAKRAADAKQAEDLKRAEAAKQAEDAKRAADQKAKAEREAELKRQLADEEHVSAVEASPARAQYIARIAARIQNAWIKPPSARVGLDCLVSITQVPGGEVTEARVTQCNGDAAASQSIVNAVYRASPLPPPPDPALFDRNLVIHFHPDQ